MAACKQEQQRHDLRDRFAQKHKTKKRTEENKNDNEKINKK